MNTLKSKTWILGLGLLAAVGCTSENPGPTPEPNGANDRYFLAATAGNARYMMAVDDLEKDTTITTTSGIETNLAYSHYYSTPQAMLALVYSQGQSSPGAVYQLNANGALREMDTFSLPVGFVTIGNFDRYLAASRNGRTLTGANDGKIGTIFYFIDLENDNYITEKSIVTENFVGNNTAEFSGIVDAGNGQFLTGVKLIDPTGAPVDNAYVARFDADLNVIKIYEDDRISYSTGEFRSARYPHIANDASGNTYVFSGSHSVSNTNPDYRTTKKAGAVRINSGADDFDPSYYFDIETASGGYKFKRVWHVAEDYFFLEMYNEAGIGGGQNPATQYAIVRMSNNSFNWVRTGIPTPDLIESANTGWAFTTNGKAYVGITAIDAQPAVYVIDPVTATAKKGITVTGATSIPGLGRLTPQENITN